MIQGKTVGTDRKYQYISQSDERWAQQKVGLGNEIFQTKGDAVCCLAMISKQSPLTINEKLIKLNAFDQSEIIWEKIGAERVPRDAIFKRQQYPNFHQKQWIVKNNTTYTILTGVDTYIYYIIDPSFNLYLQLGNDQIKKTKMQQLEEIIILDPLL